MKRSAFSITAFLLAVPSMATSPECAHAGAFVGTFAGGDNGRFGLVVHVGGFLEGRALSSNTGDASDFEGEIQLDQETGVVSGSAAPGDDVVTGEGVTFSARFTSPDRVSGTWTDFSSSISGTFEGRRLGGAHEATYRFTGILGAEGDFHRGFLALDVDRLGKVTVAGRLMKLAEDHYLITLLFALEERVKKRTAKRMAAAMSW